MIIYLGTDHRGFPTKEAVKAFLLEEGYEVEDLGAYQLDPDDDYPEFGSRVAKAVTGEPGSRGILFCGSGHGMDMVANRYPTIRAILGFNQEVVVQGREHEDGNVLVLPADWIAESEAVEMTRTFLLTPASSDPRHVRRLQMLRGLRVDNG